MQVGFSTQRTFTTTQHSSIQHTDVVSINAINVSLAIALHVVVISAIVSYRKHRITVLRRRIQHLNRIWQLDTSKKPS